MEWLNLFIGFFIGMFVTSFTIIQIGVILFFGIPFTLKVSKAGEMIDGHPIFRNYLISSLVLIAIYCAILYGVNSWYPTALVGFWIGSVVAILFGIGKLGFNQDNKSDWMSSNHKYLKARVEFENATKK